MGGVKLQAVNICQDCEIERRRLRQHKEVSTYDVGGQKGGGGKASPFLVDFILRTGRNKKSKNRKFSLVQDVATKLK